MNEQDKAALAAAIVGGYVLGRTKKGRLAFTLATYLAGRRVGLQPRQLATEGVRRLSGMPQVTELRQQFREEFLQAGRAAVTAMANRRLGSFADSIRDRSGGPEDEAEPENDEAEPENEPEEESDDEAEDRARDEEESEEEDEEEPRGPAPGESRSARTSASPPRESAAKKAAPAKKATAKKTAPARESAASPRQATRKPPTRPDRRR